MIFDIENHFILCPVKKNITTRHLILDTTKPVIFIDIQANQPSYLVDCFATFYKSALRIWLFGRDFVKYQIRTTANLLRKFKHLNRHNSV